MLIYVATGSALRVSQSGEGTNADPEGGHTLCSWLWQMRLSKGRGSPEKVPNIMGQGRVGGRGQLAVEETKTLLILKCGMSPLVHPPIVPLIHLLSHHSSIHHPLIHPSLI